MKKPPTDQIDVLVRFGDIKHYVGPGEHVDDLIKLLVKLNFKLADRAGKKKQRLSWESLAGDRIKEYTEPGLALRGARLRENLSQEGLAKRVGVSRNNISKMERGKRSIGKKMSKRLAEMLRTDYRLFL